MQILSYWKISFCSAYIVAKASCFFGICHWSIFFHVKVQTYDKARNAVALALSPVVRALVDPDGAMRDIRNLDSVRDVLLSNIFGLVSLFWSISVVALLFLGYKGKTLVPETTYHQ